LEAGKTWQLYPESSCDGLRDRFPFNIPQCVIEINISNQLSNYWNSDISRESWQDWELSIGSLGIEPRNNSAFEKSIMFCL
jgi:hypothetical protein